MPTRMSTEPVALVRPENCRNCGSPAPGRYCPQCGQSTALHPPTVGEFMHEFVGHYVALEGALWRTLRTLVLRPGKLTRAYLEGQRSHYLLPLRVYLSLSFVLFIALKLAVSLGTTDDATKPAAQASRTGIASVGLTHGPLDRPSGWAVAFGPQRELLWCTFPIASLCERAALKFRAFDSDPQREQQKLIARFISWSYWALFALVPLFGWLVWLLRRKQGERYGEHLLFAMHVHSAWFIAIGLGFVLPASLELAWQLALPLYLWLALRGTYGMGWLKSLVAALGLFATHMAVVLVSASALSLAGFLL